MHASHVIPFTFLEKKTLLTFGIYPVATRWCFWEVCNTFEARNMHKPQTRVIILPCWMFVVFAATLATLFPAFLYCVREIAVLKSRVDAQQLTIETLETVTAQIRLRTVGDEGTSDKTNEALQRLLQLEV